MRQTPWPSRRRWSRLRRRSMWLMLAAAPLAALLLIPLLALLARVSPVVAAGYLGDESTRQALTLSLTTTAMALALAVALGTPVALLLARGRFSGQRLLEVLVDLPTVLPPAVAGVALLMAFGRRGWLGPALQDVGVDIAFTTAAVVLAQLFVAAPYYVKAASVGLAAVSHELHEAAALDGATSAQTFWQVTLPLAWRGILGGATLCWARALGEFGATIIFAGNYPGRTQTMPLAVYIGFEIDLNRALTLAAILLVVSFGVLALMRWLLRPVRD